MARHLVICPYCKKQFDAQPNDQGKVWIKINATRYAHIKCHQEHEANLTQNQKDHQMLYKYCKQLFGDEYNYVLTEKLINKYIKENKYTYSSIYKTLKWWYEIEGNSTEKAGGTIGIVPYAFNQARQYYYKLYLAQQQNRNINTWNPDIVQIDVSSFDPFKRPPRLIDLDKIDQEEI